MPGDIASLLAQLDAAQIARRLPAARRRAATARRIADRRQTPENDARAEELEDGLARMEAQASV